MNPSQYHFLRLISITVFLAFTFATPISAQEKSRKKVGIALSGGGAKGFAHIGALKVLEEAGIPIDYIAGTSMGAIIGGLYALGYSASDLDSIAKAQDWNYLLTDNVYRENLSPYLKENANQYIVSLPYELQFKQKSGKVSLPSGVVKGQNLDNLFLNLTIGFQDAMKFDQLPIPFGCVAADTRSGREVDLTQGILAQAMRASMAIPGMFAPVEIDSMLLIDGGIINNYPVDLVRKMGADIVIGVVMPPGDEEKDKNRGTLFEVISGLSNFIGKEKFDENIRNTDLLISADLHPYGMMDFERNSIDTIIFRGEKATREKWDELISLKSQLGITDEKLPDRKEKNPFIEMDSLEIGSIHFSGITPDEEQSMLKSIRIKNNKITRKELETLTSQIYGTGFFNSVRYELKGEPPFDLFFRVEKKDFKTLNLGLRFDTDDIAAILANTVIRRGASFNSVMEITARLSKNPYLTIDYYLNRGIFYRGGITYRLRRNEIDIFDRGQRSYSFGVTQNTMDLNFSEFYFRNIKLHLGVNFDNYYFFSTLSNNIDLQKTGFDNKLYINYFLEGTFDNLDRSYFPTSGGYLLFRYAMLTDNFYEMNHKLPLNVLNLKLTKPFKIGQHIFLTPEITGRTIINSEDSIPAIYRNFAGGKYDGNYLTQQISLPGSGGMEVMNHSVLKFQANLRYEMTQNQWLYANLHILAQNDKPLRIFNGQYFKGINLGYSYMTVLGPFSIEAGYSELTKKIHAFLGIGYYF